MSSTYAIDALVLSRRDIGEADRLLTVFSRTMGKLRLVAKGVRRPTSRMGAHLEPGRESQLFVVERRSLPLVTQAQTRRVYLSRTADLAELRDLFALLEITSNLLDDGQRDSRLYDLLVATLEQFWAAGLPADMRAPTAQSHSASQQRTLLTAAYILKALHMLGYSMELTTCPHCNQPLRPDNLPTPPRSTPLSGGDMPRAIRSTPGQFYLSASRGGVLHGQCGSAGPGSFVIDSKTLQTLRELLRAKLATIAAVPGQPAGPDLLRPLMAFVEWTSERSLKSSLI